MKGNNNLFVSLSIYLCLNELLLTFLFLLFSCNLIKNVFCPAATYSVSKAENTSPGNLITTVTANDPDIDDIVTYSWVTSTTEFTLDQSSGQILLAATLDRETTPSYSLLVEGSDGTNTVTATVSLTVTDINDNAPVFNPTSYR